MSMKMILVPTEQREGMRSVLQTALLLARRFDSYIEGFALRFEISMFVAAGMGDSIPLESFKQESIEEVKKTRDMFESFMQDHNVPRFSPATSSLSFGWLVVLRQKTRRLFLLNLLTQYGHLGSILAIATIKR